MVKKCYEKHDSRTAYTISSEADANTNEKKYIYKIPKLIKEKKMYTKCDITTGMEINTNEITKKKLLSTGNNIPRLKYIYDFKNAFKNCAHSYMDKNAGAGILLCPQLLWILNNKTFNENTAHYIHREDMSTESTMDLFKSNYISLNLDRVQCFDTRKSVPYAYIIPKFKNITTMRPIVSYYHHPLKNCLNLASRALACVLKIAKLDEFVLWKTQDLNKEIK